MPETLQICGTPVPTEDDIPIGHSDTPGSIWVQIQNICSQDSSVFFYRYQGQFYMRVVDNPG